MAIIRQRKPGRPRKEPDKQDFEALISIGCEQDEVLAFFGKKFCGFDRATLFRWIKREYGEDESFATISSKMGLPLQKTRVRKGIMEMVGKNAAVTIFAAKNVLGWTDKLEQTVNDASHMSLDVNLIKSKLKDGDSNAN